MGTVTARMPSLIASTAGFGTAHIAATAAISGAVPLLGASSCSDASVGWLKASRSRSSRRGRVFLRRKSANMPQLSNDGLPPFSANDWLAPTLTYVVLGLYASVRPTSNDRRFAQARALAVLGAFIVNVVTI